MATGTHIFGLFTIFAIIGLTAGQAGPVELTFRPSSLLKQGDDLSITCVVQNMGFFDFVEVVRQIEGREYKISDNGVLKDEVAATGRYAITYEKVFVDGTFQQTATVVINITSIEGEDGGNIGCKNGAQKQSVFKDLIVQGCVH
eukprot:GHVU01151593.1.p1 GENE.GHVU01151593.1~~GHVU01151593.1.p1  ORF type:complete len:161 (-),score=18.75 GHVU01151593.1:223-654(-)